MLIFNKAISALALVKIPLTGKKKIHQNKQTRLSSSRKAGLVLTSVSWATSYLQTLARTFTIETSDQV